MKHLKNSSQEVNKVYKTSDLTIFKQIKGNRPPNPKHIRRLSGSIKENGILQNPIIVNEDMVVIDGQHRLMAAREASSSIYYIIVRGYTLEEVHVLNLNQKNWTKEDFMNGYADMGVGSYVKLRDFYENNDDFSLGMCITMCANTTSGTNAINSQKYRIGRPVVNLTEVFEEGTWKGKDFKLAQENADKIRMMKAYYEGYKRSSFVAALLGLFKNDEFDFFEFLQKVKIQPQSVKDCVNVAQYKMLIEDIYNYRRRKKVNLRF